MPSSSGSSLPAIRPLVDADLPAAARLASQLGYPAAPGALAERLPALAHSPSHALLAADVDGVLLGWIHVEASYALIHDPLAEIVSLVVDADRRSRGVGVALVRAAEAWARSRGLARLRVRCRVEREDAHRFYEREGFEREKTQLVFSKSLRRI
jgi:GNAT superfamily N-acetyltransferase